MKRASRLLLGFLLALLLFLTLLAFWRGHLQIPSVLTSPEGLWRGLIRPMIRLTLFISAGLFIGQVIEAMAWTHRLTALIRPLMRWGRMSDPMGAAFMTAFFSGSAALAMLHSFHDEGRMSGRDVAVAVLLNTFPSYFLHLPTTVFIILPLVGKAGAIYLCLTFLAALLRLQVVLLINRFIQPVSKGRDPFELESKSKSRGDIMRATGRKFRSRLGHILTITLPVYLIVAVISEMGFFDWLKQSLAGGVISQVIPLEAVSVIVFSLAAEFTSGYAAAGALLEAGSLSTYQAAMALLLGNVIASPVRAIRHQMPYYLGIFRPRAGAYLLLGSQAVRVVSLAIVGALFVLMGQAG
jgi:hypothetical protein